MVLNMGMSDTTNDCDFHAKQVLIPNPDGGTVWVCEGCFAICAIEPARFEVGQRCSARSACDWDMVFRWTVVARTAKFVTFEDERGERKRVGIKVDSDGEWAMPQGVFSMAPVVRAGRIEA
jgi:hypothetical protein